MTRKKELPNFAQELRDLLQYENKIPPVESWNPQRRGEVDITIKRDGSWWFQDEEMTRQATIQLFSRILHKESDGYYLVTPVEKMKLKVDVAPFVVRMMDVQGSRSTQEIIFSTNVGDTFVLSKTHALTMRDLGEAEPAPFVEVRNGLEALISRQVYYELAELAIESPDHPGHFGVWSSGTFFEL